MPAQKIAKLVVVSAIVIVPVLLTTDISAAHRTIQFRKIDSTFAFNRININTSTGGNYIGTTRTSPQPSSTTPRPSASTTATPAAQTNSNYSQQILDLVNTARRNNNLSTLTLNNELTKSAQDYAKLMATQNFFSHTTPEGGTMKQRIVAAGYTPYRWIAENIAAGQRSPQEVFNGWMNSPGHRANILNTNAQHLGVGYAQATNAQYKTYWVQHFGAK